MIRAQFTLDLNGELIVDNFAGGGGASTGIELALGRHVDIAVNHDPEAVAMHTVNHPQTQHFCEDVFQIDPVAVTNGRPVGLAWFSPDCKHFSKAKGGKPRSKKIRGLAWVVVKWAATVRPRVIMLENVEEFQTWGPLLEDGRPCPRRKGQTFRNWVARLVNLGYRVEWRELRACDYGAPTIRKRLFLVARCDGRPIVWPEPSHGDPKLADTGKRRLKPWRTAAECIDWSIPCPSIFERERPLAEATLRRIARGIYKFVINSPEPFIVKYHTAKRPGDDRVGSIYDPIPTQTTENRFGIAVPSVARVAPFVTECANSTHDRVFDAQEPLRTQCAEVKGGHFATVAAFLAKHYGGNETPGSSLSRPVDTITATDHNALVSTHLVRHFGQSIGGEITEPVGTVCAGGGGKTGLVTSHLSKIYGTTTGHDAREPLHTVTSGGNHIAEVRAFLVKYYGNDRDGVSLREPMHTVTAKDRVGLVTIHGEEYVITDIGMRMLEPHELYAAQGFPQEYNIAPVVNGRRLPKHAQVRMCGNSVCPPVANAIVAANVPELATWYSKERRRREVAA